MQGRKRKEERSQAQEEEEEGEVRRVKGEEKRGGVKRALVSYEAQALEASSSVRLSLVPARAYATGASSYLEIRGERSE